MTILINGDYKDFEAELDRVGRQPTGKTRKLLDGVLLEGFAQSQSTVHVITGSLKGSGKKRSKVNRLDKEWEGVIEYGGASTGVKNPVDYAIYEFARHEGHDDFIIKNVNLLHSQFIAAMKGGLSK